MDMARASVTIKQLTVYQTINKILREAESAVGTADFWLAADNYEDAPHKRPKHTNLGTSPPIDENFRSPWIGKKVENCVNWLQQKPDTVDLDVHHFAVLDRQAAVDGIVVTCKIGDRHLEGIELKFLRKPAVEASAWLVGLEFGDWARSPREGEAFEEDSRA